MIIVNVIPHLSSAWYSSFSFNLFFFLSLTSSIDFLRKITKIIENMTFSLIFLLRKIWYFRQFWKIIKIWYLRSVFLQKCCFSCSVSLKKIGKIIFVLVLKILLICKFLNFTVVFNKKIKLSKVYIQFSLWENWFQSNASNSYYHT